MADYGLTRNGSGYRDETAYKAIMGMAKSGEIWTANDGREEVLILKNQGSLCNCLSLTDKASDARCIEIDDAGYTNPSMVKYLFNQRLGRFVRKIPDGEFAQIMEAVEDALSIGKPIDRRKEAHELLDMILDRAGGL